MPVLVSLYGGKPELASFIEVGYYKRSALGRVEERNFMIVIKEVVADYVIHGAAHTMHARIIKSSGAVKSFKWEISHWILNDGFRTVRPNIQDAGTLEEAYRGLSEYVKGYTSMTPTLNPDY